MKKRKKKVAMDQVLLHTFFICSLVAFILPLVLVISISLSEPGFLYFRLWPEKVSFWAYEVLMRNPGELGKGFLVTFIYSAAGVVGSTVINALFAYALSRKVLKGRGFIIKFIFFQGWFGGSLIGKYLVIAGTFHMDETIWAYIIPYLWATYNVLVLRTCFQQQSEEMFEAARIDGASEFKICFKIAMPMAAPILVTQAYEKFLGGWNDWMTSSIYVRRNLDLRSLQAIVKGYMDDISYLQKILEGVGMVTKVDEAMAIAEPLRYAACIVTVLPILLVFPFLQKYFDKGMTVGSLKG